MLVLLFVGIIRSNHVKPWEEDHGWAVDFDESFAMATEVQLKIHQVPVVVGGQ